MLVFFVLGTLAQIFLPLVAGLGAQAVLMVLMYVLILKLYKRKKKVLLEVERKRFETIEDYILSVKDISDYGSQLIPVLNNSLESVTQKT